MAKVLPGPPGAWKTERMAVLGSAGVKDGGGAWRFFAEEFFWKNIPAE
jgi:hypothetical protein